MTDKHTRKCTLFKKALVVYLLAWYLPLHMTGTFLDITGHFYSNSNGGFVLGKISLTTMSGMGVSKQAPRHVECRLTCSLKINMWNLTITSIGFWNRSNFTTSRNPSLKLVNWVLTSFAVTELAVRTKCSWEARKQKKKTKKTKRSPLICYLLTKACMQMRHSPAYPDGSVGHKSRLGHLEPYWGNEKGISTLRIMNCGIYCKYEYKSNLSALPFGGPWPRLPKVDVQDRRYLRRDNRGQPFFENLIGQSTTANIPVLRVGTPEYSTSHHCILQPPNKPDTHSICKIQLVTQALRWTVLMIFLMLTRLNRYPKHQSIKCSMHIRSFNCTSDIGGRKNRPIGALWTVSDWTSTEINSK